MGCRRLAVLCWKTCRVLLRRWLSTIAFLLFPAMLALALLYVRAKSPQHIVVQPTKWKHFDLNFIPIPRVLDERTRSSLRMDHWHLAYAPVNNMSTKIMEKIKLPFIDGFIGFSSELALETYFADKKSKLALAGIIFDNVSLFSDVIYTIRMRSAENWNTRLLYPQYRQLRPRSTTSMAEPPPYVMSGFIALQATIDNVISLMVCGGDSTDLPISVTMKRLPYPPYVDDSFVPIIQQQLPILLAIGYFFPAVGLAKSVLEEKQERVKGVLRMLGTNLLSYWLSWLLPYGLLFAGSAGLLTGILSIDFSVGAKMLSMSDPSVIFCSICIYAFSLMSFVFALSTLFDSPHAGAAVTCAVLILSYAAYQLMTIHYDHLVLVGKLFPCLLPNVAVGFLLYLIGRDEGVGDRSYK